MPGELDKAPMNIDIYKNIVKANNPQFLQRFKDFLREYGGVQGGRSGDEIAEHLDKKEL